MKKDLTLQLAPQVLAFAQHCSMRAGDALREVAMADALGVSRSPIRKVFGLFASLGLAYHAPNRGYFLLQHASEINASVLPQAADPLEDFYLKVVADFMSGRIATDFFEAELLRRYQVPRGQLLKVLNRLMHEGMIERRPGQGWSLNRFVETTQAHFHSYRFRMAIEPTALLEPGYTVDKVAFAEAKRRQQALLDGEIYIRSPAELFDIGAQLHELIVQCSGNPYFVEAIRQQNQLRRFSSYQPNLNQERLLAQCREHIHLLELIENGEREQAAAFLRSHLEGACKAKLPAT